MTQAFRLLMVGSGIAGPLSATRPGDQSDRAPTMSIDLCTRISTIPETFGAVVT